MCALSGPRVLEAVVSTFSQTTTHLAVARSSTVYVQLSTIIINSWSSSTLVYYVHSDFTLCSSSLSLLGWQGWNFVCLSANTCTYLIGCPLLMALSVGLRNSCLATQALPAVAQLSRCVATYAFTTPKEALARQVVHEPKGQSSRDTYR